MKSLGGLYIKFLRMRLLEHLSAA